MPIKLQQPSEPTAPPTVLEQAAALQIEEPAEIVEEAENLLLPIPESRYAHRTLPYGLTEKLTQIELILAGDKKEIPIDTLRLACKAVMQCLKANEDSILKLEPEDMQLVVQGYIKSADQATKEALAPKKKKTRAKKVTPLPPEREEF